jgi:hypothetical protein
VYFADETVAGPSRVKSDKKKEFEKSMRKQSKITRNTQNKNDDFHKECPKCIQEGTFDSERPHSSTRSPKCAWHTKSIDEELTENLGKGYERYVRRTPLSNALIGNLDEKVAMQSSFNDLATKVKQIIVKGQLFALYNLLYTLETRQVISPMIFTQEYYYACCQLVVGQQITSPNQKLGKEGMKNVFQLYKTQFPEGLVRHADSNDTNTDSYMTAVASLAADMAKNSVNHVCETYQARCLTYIKFKIRATLKEVGVKTFRYPQFFRTNLLLTVDDHRIVKTIGVVFV